MSEQLDADTEIQPIETAVSFDSAEETTVDEAEKTPEPAGEEETAEESIPLAAQKIIADKAFREREARREAAELKRKLAEYEQAKQPQAPSVPDVPNYWDFASDADYKAAIVKRDESIRQAIAYEQQQQYTLRQQQLRAETEAQARNQELAQKAESYSQRAKSLGIKPEELQVAGNIVASYGLREDIALAILDDPEGALVTKYLASNPSAIAKLNGGNLMTFNGIYTDIRTKAAGLKPKTSNAPPPADVLKGGSPAKQRGVPGATFE